MRNKILALLFLGFMSVYGMEESGGFIGFDVGGEVAQALTSPFPFFPKMESEMSVMSYGGKVGYKKFINDYFGLRGYFDINYQEVKENYYYFVGSRGRIGLLNYGVNADILINFYNTDFTNLGIFAGVGVGYTNVKIDVVQVKESKSRFNANVKAGVRVNAGDHHGIEFTATIPIVYDVVDYRYGIKRTLKPTYITFKLYLYILRGLL